MWTFYSSVILLSVIQIQHVVATGCNIVSLTSQSASTLSVMWSSYPGASYYMLDLKVVNATNIATVAVMQSAPSTQRLVQGLRPGRVYQVTLKVLEFWNVVCQDVEITMTVPATSQITYSKAISSSSIEFEWSKVTGADSYTLFIETLFVDPTIKYNQTFTTLKGRMDGLLASTTYNCYIYSSNIAGSGARSSIKSIMTLVQPPTGVALVSTGKSSAHLTWASVSKVLLYQVTVSDIDNPSNTPVIRETSDTSMDITNLEPCSTYTVGVSSVNIFLIPGEPRNVNHTTSTINPVTSVSVNYNCSSGMVTVTWDLVFGANLYRAMAVDSRDQSLNCTSASTSCQITQLNCGEKYEVRVAAISDDCSNTSEVSAMFETVPCAPVNLSTQYQCSSNVILFSWQPTNKTYYYIATAEDDAGKVTECRTVDTMCHFSNVNCGQFYRYTVYAVSSGCNSEVSQPKSVQTSPCVPTNVMTADECHPDVLITTWDSAAGALSYTVEAEGNTDESYSCTSSSNSCAVTGVPCGEHLSVWITASNDNCNTTKVLGGPAQTVPCSPINISVSVDCSQDSAKLNWTTRHGAVFYIAVAQDTSGKKHSCNSMGTNCLIEGLTCGQNYTASVIGTNFKCNSTGSDEVTFMTAPCPPTNIEAFRDCQANHALIVWQNHRSTGLYTATLVDRSGAQLACTSNTVNNCKITSLPCGKKYNVSVTYTDGNCQSTSTIVSMDSVPCGPEDVTAGVACVTGELTVAWNISAPSENYTAIISRGMGQDLHCNSTDTQCTTGGLLCGSSYRVIVFSVTGSCFSLPSTEALVQTLPCPPTNVSATSTCAPSPVPVSWVASDSAKRYNAVALSSGGHRSECSTNGTSCSLPALQCGESYTVGVSGADDNCTGQQSSTVSVITEPCPPSNVSSQLVCGTGVARLSWAPSANAASYAVKAYGGGQNLTCNSTSPNCTLSNLGCGQAYDIHVTATDGTCVSSHSAPFTQDTVPCTPQNISTNMVCGTNGLMVRWTRSSEPLNYSVTALPLAGNLSSTTCHSESSSCSLTGLRCGWTYNVSVKASSASCSGPWSTPQTVQTAPCPPQGITAVAHCGTDSLTASWNSSLGATTYTTTVTGPDGFSDSCSSPNLTCSVSGLQCASQYNVTVTSEEGRCTSAPSRTVITTGPCDPVNVTSNLHCGSDVATVSWGAAAGAVAYTVFARDSSAQNNVSCRSSSTSCQLSQLRCGRAYNLTVVAEDDTCNSTGSPRAVLMTAPCSPSVQNSTQMCGTNSSSLSWGPVADAIGYMVNATSINGHTVSGSSANTTCTLTDLLCSETYEVTVVAQGSQCDSAPGPSTNITTAPCPPHVTSKQYSCATNTAVFSWTDPAGSLGFRGHLAGEGYQDSCRTTNTSCVFKNLPCDSGFNVTVQAQGAHCTSDPSASESLRTVPCAPQNVSATLGCFNHSTLVTWVGSPSAVGYNVTATGRDGHTLHCHTNTTMCGVPDILCGETYLIKVTPYSETCMGEHSAPLSFSAGLCAPSNVTASRACEDSTVSWSLVAGAEMYVANATTDDGHTQTCSSNTSLSCNFTDLRCGDTYSVTVVTVDRGCPSEPSSAAMLQTALCSSTNLTGQVDCDADTLTLTWDPSPEPGASYSLQTERMGGALPPSNHTTTNTSHTFTNLLCGQRYAFRIAAQDGICLGSYSPPTEISTAPCQPTNFTARMDCGSNSGNFSWVESIGAGLYSVEVTGEHGHVTSCSSNDTSCTVKLHCGRSYSAILVASTESCNSTKRANIHFQSAPCLPGDVVADINCHTNVMNVSWTQNMGSDDYTAWAIGLDGHNTSCNSTSNSCCIHDLQCGQEYEVVVTSSSIHCSVIAGSDYRVQAAPCKPENITVDQNCSSNVMTVKWDRSGTNQNHTVTASSASGANSTCDSAESSCSFLDLSCGQRYTFTVTGHTNVCMSEISTSIDKTTAPCPPTNVSAELNCTTHKALVSWNTAAAATAYSIQANSTNGHISSCSDMGTSCHLDDLVCGQQYSVVVEAMHTGCLGPPSPLAMLTTEPCVPMNLSVHYNVSTAQVTWASASGATSYSVEAVTDQGSTVTCNSTDSGCSLNGLQCGQIYNVTATAHSRHCDSLTSAAHHLMTEPCPPSNVQVNVTCELLTATVSWERSNLAVGYVAYLGDRNGQYTSCVAIDTHCTVSGLACGTEYNVWVKAQGRQYNSSDSTTVSATSGPCKPSAIEAVMDCEISSATVSWHPGVGAVSYAAELTAPSGHTSICTTNSTHCRPSQLQCGEEYNVTVTARGEACNSTAQMAGHLTTEPCVPTNLSVHYSVSRARVTWASASGATSYSVEAVTDQGSTVTCNTTDSGCSLSGLQCGQIYNVTVSTHNQACNNTVTSEPERLATEPCPPSNVQANVVCEQLTSTVSWDRSDLAVGYVAYLDNRNGHHTSCGSTDTQCTASGLTCGTVYDVWVKALGNQYNSSDSTVTTLTSAPCLPGAVKVEVNCNSDGAAVVSWNTTHGAANFSLTAPVSGSLQTLCTTQQNSCNVTNLSCGETYNLSLSVSNEQCSLAAPMPANLTTRPCPPQRVDVNLRCGSSSTVLSWEEDSDVDLYTATATKASGGEVERCNSTGSNCHFHDLACGETYNFTVAAHSQGCCSQASDTVSIRTEPCQPVITSAQVPCQSDRVQISWSRASGAMNYWVTAAGSLGYVDAYNTTQTLLSATLPCGQEYIVTVQGQGSECDSVRSSPAFFRTPPCVPRDVRTHVQCESNVGSVSWRPSDGAESYVAVATGLDGHNRQCVTNTTSCTWSDLHCGEEYTVVVRAKDENCTSVPSNSSVIHMDPCVPQNLVASVHCNMKVVSLSWAASNGTKVYMVSAEGGDNTTGLTTNGTTAHFSDLACGRNYSLAVTPHNPQCPGSSSAPAPIQTWPCPPSGISATQNCPSGNVMVTWQAGNGSDYYTVTVETDSGISETSMSNSNQKSFPGLACGHNFSVSVSASNEQCNTTSSETTSLQSVPCVPTDVSVVMDCANNSALVSWSASRGALQYSVTARGSHGNVSCQASALSCSLGNLTCGSSYSVQVAAMDDSCSSSPSQAVVLKSAPCPPQNVSSHFNCSTNDLAISWDATRDADRFLVSAVADSGGLGESRNTTTTACTFRNVTCGQTFTIHATSVRGNCSSQHGQSRTVLSAPCPPRGIRGNLDCVTNSAWISWDAAPGADSYTVSAVGGGNHKANCSTSSNTTCEVEDLGCGVLYNFRVAAKNGQCESPPGATIDLQTASCSLAAITAVSQCHNSSILVMWALMEGGPGNTVYMATAEASDHSRLYCNATGTSCYLDGAQCDLHYTIIVAASSDQCSSMRSPPYRISMEPCPPRNVTVDSSCEDHGVLVSWTRSPVAETYSVVAMAADGHVHTCNTTSNNCSISDLHGDEQYTVFVTAHHENCSSRASQNATVNTGPSQPVGVSVTFNCSNRSAVLSWTPGDNAVEYYGCAQSADGEMLYCDSTGGNCTIEGLQCGTVYNFSVQASDGTCNSSFSDPVQRGAAPCPPDTVELQLLPMQAEVQVMSFSWTQVSCGDPEYLLVLTGSLLGDGQALFELSSYWTNRTYFEIPLPCGSSYEATVQSRNSGGSSGASVALSGTTAPCPPSAVVYSGNSTFASISWNASVYATAYTLYDNSVTPWTQLCRVVGRSCSLSNITSSSLVITASNSAGESEAEQITNVIPHVRRRRHLPEVQEGHLSAPTLHITQIAPTVVLAEWETVEDSSHYTLERRKQGSSSSSETLTVYGDMILITDLSPNSNYCFTVSARNSFAHGPDSEPVCVQTGAVMQKM